MTALISFFVTALLLVPPSVCVGILLERDGASLSVAARLPGARATWRQRRRLRSMRADLRRALGRES
jgi:hypothetical protein